MTAMRRVRPVWAIVAAASAVVVLASVVGSVATGMGWHWMRNELTFHFDYGLAVCNGGMYARIKRNDHRYTGLAYTDLTKVLNLPPSSNCWWFQASMQPGFVELIVPLWAVGVVSGTVCVFASRRSRRSQRGHCTKCSYNLAGLRGDVCPECGETITSKGPAK
jgi:hypothetical protein